MTRHVTHDMMSHVTHHISRSHFSVWAVTLVYPWHDSLRHVPWLLPVTWLIRTCDITLVYPWHDSLGHVPRLLPGTWLIQTCAMTLIWDMTHSDMCHNSCVPATWLNQTCAMTLTCAMTHSDMWHNSCVYASLSDMCHFRMPTWLRPAAGHDSCVSEWVMPRVHKSHGPHGKVAARLMWCVTWLIMSCVACLSESCHSESCHMPQSHVTHHISLAASFPCGPWLLCTRGMTHSDTKTCLIH